MAFLKEEFSTGGCGRVNRRESFLLENVSGAGNVPAGYDNVEIITSPEGNISVHGKGKSRALIWHCEHTLLPESIQQFEELGSVSKRRGAVLEKAITEGLHVGTGHKVLTSGVKMAEQEGCDAVQDREPVEPGPI